VLANLRLKGFGVNRIAAVTGRAPSTVSRELRRNKQSGAGYASDVRWGNERHARMEPSMAQMTPALHRLERALLAIEVLVRLEGLDPH